jgi:4-amino-4-deoxy-L-arabinose transferase-like glycosyltransferase
LTDLAETPTLVEGSLAVRSEARATGSRVAGLLAPAVLIVVAATVRIPSLHQPLLEAHPFRQTETAYPALIFHERGIDLLHPQLPVFGPPWQVPFEFPLYQVLATVPMHLGVGPDTSLRLTALACFLLTGLLLFALVRLVASTVAAYAALLVFLFSPFALLWSRASMIEYLATAGAVGWAYAGIRWRETRRPMFAVLAVVLGTIAMLVKVTTAAFWVLPLLAYRTTASRARGFRGGLLHPATVAVVVVPFVLETLWNRHADNIKGAHPETAWLTSSALHRWNFGTLHQRLDPHVWLTILFRIELIDFAGIGIVLLVLAALAVSRSGQFLFWLAIAGTVLLPILTFTNLYQAHDYYLIAVSPGLAALFGVGAGAAMARFEPVRERVAVLVLALVWAVGGLWLQHWYWGPIYDRVSDPGGYRSLANELAAVTKPNDLVLTEGLDWNPAVFYYARRRGLMLRPADPSPSLAARIRPEGYSVLFDAGSGGRAAGVARLWPWVGTLSAHTYALAVDARRLRGASAISTSDRTAFVRAAALGHELLGGSRRVECDGSTTALGRYHETVWLELAGSPGRGTFRFGAGPALPLREVAIASPSLAAGKRGLTFSCRGTGAVLIRRAVTAPL